MITEQYRADVHNAVEKRKQDPLYRPSPDERKAIDAVLEADWNSLHQTQPVNHDLPTMIAHENPLPPSSPRKVFLASANAVRGFIEREI